MNKKLLVGLMILLDGQCFSSSAEKSIRSLPLAIDEVYKAASRKNELVIFIENRDERLRSYCKEPDFCKAVQKLLKTETTRVLFVEVGDGPGSFHDANRFLASRNLASEETDPLFKHRRCQGIPLMYLQNGCEASFFVSDKSYLRVVDAQHLTTSLMFLEKEVLRREFIPSGGFSIFTPTEMIPLFRPTKDLESAFTLIGLSSLPKPLIKPEAAKLEIDTSQHPLLKAPESPTRSEMRLSSSPESAFRKLIFH